MHGVTKIETFDEVSLVSFKEIPHQTGLIAEIFQHYAQHKMNLDMISQTAPTGDQVSLSFTCYTNDLVDLLSISNALQDRYPHLRPMVSSGNCKIYLFGEEMRQTPGVFARAMECLHQVQVEPQLVTTSEVDISLLVPSAHTQKAATALKEAFGL